MPGFNPENINIHNLTIEEPEQAGELPFDPERDITEEDWQKMEEHRKKYLELEKKEKGSWATYIWSLSAKQVIIGRKPEMPPEYIENIDNERKRWAHPDSQFQFSPRFLYDLKIMGFDVTPNEQEAKHFDTAMKHIGPEVSLEVSAIAKVLNFPGYELSREKEEKIMTGEGLDSLVWAEKHNKWNEWASRAAYLKVLGKNIKVSKEQWEKLLEQLDKYRNDGTENTFFLSNLAILSAEGAHIPEGGGLELVRHRKTDLQLESPQIPEQRKF